MGEHELKDRIKIIRKHFNLTQAEFAKRLGTVQNTITGYETGRRNPSGSAQALICKEFAVNEIWLETGEGEMLKDIPEEDETAAIVSELLEDGGETELYELIKSIMRTYQQLDGKSQKTLNDFIGKSYENMKKK